MPHQASGQGALQRLGRRLRDAVSRRARREEFVVLVARVPDGFSPGAGRAAIAAIELGRPDRWIFASPTMYCAYFRRITSGDLRRARSQAALAALRTFDASVRELELVEEHGWLMARFDWKGRLLEQPLGSTEPG